MKKLSFIKCEKKKKKEKCSNLVLLDYIYIGFIVTLYFGQVIRLKG